MKTKELTPKHFSRYGEFLASFELSKRGWNVYSPIYDEYIDLIIHKAVCKSCKELWEITPTLICKKCGREIVTTNKSRIQAIKICADCGHRNIGNVRKCQNCGKNRLVNRPTCPFSGCNGEVEIHNHICKCRSKTYRYKFRTVQVKSSRLEYRKGKPTSYAVDMKPRDMITDPDHFFIWVCIDKNDKPHFLVMSVDDFKKTMGTSLLGISFLKDQDRQHFHYTNFGKWGKFLNRFDKLK